MCNQRGSTLAEMLITIGSFGLLTCIAVPLATHLMWRATLKGAAVRIHALMVVTKEDAIAMNRNRAIKFIRNPHDGWSYAIYVDGDNDGVLNADIDKGIDLLVDGPHELLAPGALATIGIPRQGLPDPDGGARIRADASPVQFNRSMLCSFGSDGSGTAGSVYLRSVAGDAAVVRCSGEDGRISVLVLDRFFRRWRSFN